MTGHSYSKESLYKNHFNLRDVCCLLRKVSSTDQTNFDKIMKAASCFKTYQLHPRNLIASGQHIQVVGFQLFDASIFGILSFAHGLMILLLIFSFFLYFILL